MSPAFQLNASMLSPAPATTEENLGTTSAGIGTTQTAFFAAAALLVLALLTSLLVPRPAEEGQA